MLKCALPLLLSAASVLAIAATAPSPAHAARWGDAPHHREMQQHHDEIRAYIDHMDMRLMDCAVEAARHLNNNDWHAAKGYYNIPAWDHRRMIMREFKRCLNRQTGKR